MQGACFELTTLPPHRMTNKVPPEGGTAFRGARKKRASEAPDLMVAVRFYLVPNARRDAARRPWEAR